jgi:hypothetical protein
MSRAEILAILAFVVSVTSLSFSAYFGLRDRGRVRAESKFHPASEYTYARMAITLVNEGRRPIVLRMLVGTSEDGKWVGEYLGKKKGGLRLGEHERLDMNIEREDAVGMTADDDIVFADLWVEDSLGRRYRVKNAKDHLQKLLASPSQSNLSPNADARDEAARAG